jgi:hypothetical protein
MVVMMMVTMMMIGRRVGRYDRTGKNNEGNYSKE